MKKILLLLVSFLSPFAGLMAQSISMNVDSIHGTGTTDESDIGVTTTLTNGLGVNDSIHWVRVMNVLPANWSSAVCDPNLCYSDNTSSEDFYMTDGGTGTFIIHFKPNGYVGDGLVKLVANPHSSIHDTISCIYTCHVDLYNNVTAAVLTNAIVFFPNPASNILYAANTTEKAIGRIEIYNVLGSLVKSVNYSDGMKTSLEVNVSDLHDGLYFIKAFSTDGSVLVTKKFKKAE